MRVAPSASDSTSRMTLPAQASAPLARRERLKEALRASREAVSDLERQLERLERQTEILFRQLQSLRSHGWLPGAAP